ncbi:hypothetical protein RAJCM14343_2739 [Rhodococcus aetherivorans]|uniref:Helix-turn-helix domain-containing protein n=1 Tax=Rhodococcus aetherivorans TaxID=191292 RepID=A0ABQ0YM09_9NOCA|nr:hypothetical protein [Rhodococcus aetherivorans]ETT28028.1 hypothetical protein RR21198_1385 [Rhodococcus rhodochrous ATCC 21198]NGP27275.1 hypothetical protein [Rhodococcus aetherivorans]GES37484.1 hypothetical protein RAJCM14343_2739 [Rhodococcus aetherivorans]
MSTDRQIRNNPPRPPVDVLAPGLVLVSGPALAAVEYAIRVAQDARRRNGLRPSRDLELLAASVSAAGQTDIGAAQSDETENVAEVCPEDGDWITSDQAAGLLGCTPRQARRLAPLLGGRLTGGRWLIDRLAVEEHRAGRRLSEGTAA